MADLRFRPRVCSFKVCNLTSKPCCLNLLYKPYPELLPKKTPDSLREDTVWGKKYDVNPSAGFRLLGAALAETRRGEATATTSV